MKKLFTLLFVLVLFGAQAGNEITAKGEANAPITSKDTPIWGQNWDETGATSGIVSTHFGGLSPSLVITVDNITVPAGQTWTITELRHRGFRSSVDGTPVPAPEGFTFHIYEDNGGVPGDLIIEETTMGADYDPYVSLEPDDELTLTAGNYWIGFTGFYANSTGTATGRWNVRTWGTSASPVNGSVPYLNDYADLFGHAANGWQPLTALNVQVGALDFAIFGSVETEFEVYDVTFVVDMTDAVAHGDVAFDPAIHDVYMSGSLGEYTWPQPGTEPALKLSRVDKGKSAVVVYSQDFEGETFPPEGWSKLNPDGGTGWTTATAGTEPVPGWTSGTVTASPAGGQKMAFATWNTGGATANDQWLITPKITVEAGYEISFYMRYGFSSYNDNVDIRISTTTNDNTAAFSTVVQAFNLTSTSSTNWEYYTYLLTDYVDVGDEIYIAFREHVTDNNNDGSAIFVDQFEVKYYEEVYYSLTLEMQEGTYEYKYFLVEKDGDPNWDIGEWAGDPNRTITVTGDATFNDVFGVDPFASVQEPIVTEAGEFKVFPNPANSQVKIVSGQMIREVRVFDLSGRMVTSAIVGDFMADINVSALPRGLYMVQIFGENNIQTQKLQIVR
jgi:hypothetical protein